jgi:hypothetical protein
MTAKQFKEDPIFLIGSTNIYDFQRIVGFKRWDTWLANVAARPAWRV